jgi:hypothetical protein
VGFLDLIRPKGKLKTAREKDALALRHLEARGADLSKPRHIIHFLYFAEESDARATATAVEDAGWTVVVEQPSETISEWTVRADQTRVVSSATVGSFRAWFEHVAAEHRGEYDGWEAAAKP